MAAMGLAAIFAGGAATTHAEDNARFHHIHLNVVDPAKTIDFYDKYFSGVRVKFRGKSDAILTDRSYILLSKVESQRPWELTSALYHIGWGGVDGPSEFAWRDKEGVQWETPLSSLGAEHYMYAFGPDKEVVEIWTGFRHNRFGHIHLLSDNVVEAKNWYVKFLGLEGPSQDRPKPPKAPEDSGNAVTANIFQYLWTSQVSTVNGVTINLFARPSEDTLVWWPYGDLGPLVKSDGRVIDHIGFSFRDIEPIFKRMKDGGADIVEPIEERPEYGMKSFFVRGPDGILIEVVEAKPIPESSWE